VAGTLHCGVDPGGPCNETTGSGSGLVACSGCQTGYNTYSVIINRTNTSAESMTYYLNGTAYFTVTEAQIGTATWQAAIDHGFFLILDLAIGGGFPNAICGCTSPSASTSSGAAMSVGYVAVYTTTGGGGGGNTVTVTNPGNQSGTVGTAASVQVHATDSAGAALTYSASGLPAGLSINSSTGLISGTPTTAATSSVTVTAKDGTGATGSTSFSWTISSGGGGGGSCHVVYTTQSQWAGGFVGQVVIGNTSTTAVSGWTLKFTFPGDQKITSDFNGTASMSGEAATLTNASYNGSIAPGSSVTVGFQGTWTNSDAVPTSFTLNGATCT
jgi:hypothetical protein